MSKVNRHIYLIGFMGCGKTSVSIAMNQLYGKNIVEVDDRIIAKEGRSINQIFAESGENYFRDLETDLLVEMQSGVPVIVSCGGGTPLRECNVREMRKNGRIVLLTAKPETILERVKNNHDRPLLEDNKNVSYIKELLEQRREKYEAAADLIIETDEKTADQICEEMLSRLRKDISEH